MHARRVALLIALCVTLDFASPFVPGAFRFNAEDSVEGVNAHRHESRLKATLSSRASVPARESTEMATRLLPPRQEFRAVGHWFVVLRRAHSPTAATSLVSEDH